MAYPLSAKFSAYLRLLYRAVSTVNTLSIKLLFTNTSSTVSSFLPITVAFLTHCST